jgi:4,5-DOPA dioxygenase extradiol
MSMMPSLFISHGAPTFAMEPGLAGAQLRALGLALDKPKAVVVISPHWMTQGIEVMAIDQPQTVHDFGGFPRELYNLEYPAVGSPELAVQIQQLFAQQGVRVQLNLRRGLDHGAWVPLMHLLPQADVPVIQLSMPFDTNERKAFALGQSLAPLAQDGILIIGSGSLTHNLFEFRTGEVQEAAYAHEFSCWVRQVVQMGDMDRLEQALELAPHALRAHPTKEHFLPLLVAAGAAPIKTPVTVLNGGIQHGVLAMESYAFGKEMELNIQEQVHA